MRQNLGMSICTLNEVTKQPKSKNQQNSAKGLNRGRIWEAQPKEHLQEKLETVHAVRRFACLMWPSAHTLARRHFWLHLFNLPVRLRGLSRFANGGPFHTNLHHPSLHSCMYPPPPSPGPSMGLSKHGHPIPPHFCRGGGARSPFSNSPPFGRGSSDRLPKKAPSHKHTQTLSKRGLFAIAHRVPFSAILDQKTSKHVCRTKI